MPGMSPLERAFIEVLRGRYPGRSWEIVPPAERKALAEVASTVSEFSDIAAPAREAHAAEGQS
jgi:hypothetical protein